MCFAGFCCVCTPRVLRSMQRRRRRAALVAALVRPCVRADQGQSASTTHHGGSSSPRGFCVADEGSSSRALADESTHSDAQQHGHDQPLLHVVLFGEVFRSCTTSLGAAINLCRNVTLQGASRNPQWVPTEQ